MYTVVFFQCLAVISEFSPIHRTACTVAKTCLQLSLPPSGFPSAKYGVANSKLILVLLRSWVQYGVGRIFAYFAVGLAETAVPSYCSELAPVPLRGFFAASINWFLGFGSILGSVLNRVYATHTGREGWMVPTAVQLIPALMLGIGVPFTVRELTVLFLPCQNSHRDNDHWTRLTHPA